jgi:hypothetical protein
MAIYYLDGTTLANTTAIFDDSDLTICAADGVYSDGTISREQLSCLLLPQQTCAECIPPVLPCGTGVSPPAGKTGLYNLTFDAGSTPLDVGAIVIYFNPFDIPDGIRIVYDGIYYNAVANENDGRIQSTSGVVDAFTILGNPTNTCVPTTPYTSSYDFFDGFTGADWDAGLPSPQNITINNGDDQRGGDQSYSTIVIPKTSASPSTVSVQVLGPCADTGWNIEVNCPEALSDFASSLETGGKFECVIPVETYYFAQHRNDINTFPIVTNWVFSDSNGLNVLSDGTYVMASNNVITVVSGVVTAIQVCA